MKSPFWKARYDMNVSLPDGRKMWIRAFYDFNPEEAGYVGWTMESGQTRALRELNDGDLMMIYGAASGQTKKAMRSHILGFVEIDARAIQDHEKASEESQQAKKANGDGGKWVYGLPVRRAWRALDKMSIERIAPDTYNKDAGQGIGVWGRALSPAEIETALKIKVTEVNVFGEEPISGDGLTDTPFKEAFFPSKAFPGSSGERTSTYKDGETFLYLATFEGDGAALLGRPKAFGNKSVALKIGVSNNPASRADQLNAGIPPAAKGRWQIKLQAPFADRKAAEVAEQIFKDTSRKLESLGGEFFWGDSMDAVLQFSSIPGVSRF